MPFVRPTRSELIALARTELETRLPGTDARLRRSVLDAIARVIAGAAHGFYGFLEFVGRQAFAHSAEGEFLRQWGALYGVQELAATFAQGIVEFTGTEFATIPLGTALRRADAREFITLAEGTVSGGIAQVSVISVEPGLDANTEAGVTLTLLSSLPGISADAEVIGDGITGGTDLESEESLRARIVARIRRPPGGGTVADYIARAKEYAGVTDVHVFSPIVTPNFATSIGSTTEGADVSGVWSARGTSNTVRLIIAVQTNADMANGETITLNAKLQDATDSAGAGAATFGTPIAGVVIATAPGAGGPHTVVTQYEAEIDVQAARAYLRAFEVRLTTSGTGTFKAWTAGLFYQGGPGDVGIAPLFYDRANPIPLAADLAAIQNLMNDLVFKPATATPIVYALTAVPQAFTIDITPDTAEQRAAVEAELKDLFRREAQPGGKILLSHIREAISQTGGETNHVLTVPSADVDLAGDKTKISTVGTITWV